MSYQILRRIFVSLICFCSNSSHSLPITDFETPIRNFAFGSCNRQKESQDYWQIITKTQPQLFIWAGDNIYGDTTDMDRLKAKWDSLVENPEYKLFAQQTPILATWDDHDYGQDNVGKEFSPRKQSQQLFLDFIKEPINSLRRTQEGIYWSHTYGPKGKQIKIILLDTRYHREQPGPESDILGEMQWEWLESELISSEAQFNIIVSSIQVAAWLPIVEKWSNFPAAKKRLLKLIEKNKISGVFFLSGDVHHGVISRVGKSSFSHYPLYDFTSSGLNRDIISVKNEMGIQQLSTPEDINEESVDPDAEVISTMHWISAPYIRANFGTLTFDWDQEDPKMTFELRSARKGKVVRRRAVTLSEISFPKQ